MRRTLLLTFGLLAAAPPPASLHAQAASDIFLVSLHQAGGRLTADSVRRLTNRDGYDNQPSFTPDGRSILYTSIDADRIAVFVLGNPATLQLADRRDGSVRVVASNIGRAVQKLPGRDAISFLHRDPAPPGWITVWDAGSGGRTRLVEAFAENEYHVWTPDGAIITARGSVLYRFRPGTDSDWVEFADLAGSGIQGISRLAVSADGSRLALVANH